MPFRKRALVELVNESDERHGQYFYVDHAILGKPPDEDLGYFPAAVRRANPFGGRGHGISVNHSRPTS